MECPEAMERGRNFRLVAEEEMSQLLDFLTGYLPESLKWNYVACDTPNLIYIKAMVDKEARTRNRIFKYPITAGKYNLNYHLTPSSATCGTRDAFQQTLLTYMRDRVWEFHFYVANDWPEDAICLHFPGMTVSPHGLLYESVGVFCPNDRLELLKLVRDEDILIDWSKPLYINFVHYDIAEELVRLYEGTGTVEKVVVDLCARENEEDADAPQGVQEDANTDVQVLPLKVEHAERIHELYPANDIECHEVFLRLIKTLPAAGVFANGKLAAWMVQSYYGAMFSMQTKPEYRRKGYGTKLARYLTKQVAEKGYRPFVVIRPENEASQSLYRKLGFRRLYQTVRMTFMPSTWQDAENEASILRDNLENAVRQLAVEQRVVDAFQNAGDDKTIQGTKDEEEAEVIVEEPDDEPKEEKKNGDIRVEELLEPIEEQPEERIEAVEVSVMENAEEVIEGNAEEAAEAVEEEVVEVVEETSQDVAAVEETSEERQESNAGNSE